MSWLDAYSRGEDPPSAHLRPVDPRVSPQAFERWAEHLNRAFTLRQRRWADTLNRDVRAVSDVASVAAVLHNAKARLAPLRALLAHPALPEAAREGLAQALADTVRSAQRTLEDSARDAPFALQAAVRENSMPTALTAPPAPPPPPARSGPPPGRRVIL
ncbi:hypothetical protein [Actinosynnema sp. NPDC020468]|uniref:hypothetical protein n=1 Tax=Actinosynnema sp. NPDC020468 TaxID=3154488 RepID=UPI0033D4BDD9